MIPAGWGPLIDGLVEAVWLVEPVSLRILGMNPAAEKLIGLAPGDCLGKPVIELSASLEDQFFWEDVAAGLADSIHSETLLRCSDGILIPVERHVSRIRPAAGDAIYLVELRDLRQQRRVEDELEKLVAELRATLESTADGILVRAKDGGIRSYNRLFAELWQVPQALLLQRDDPAVFAHLARSVLDPEQYTQRLAAIDQAPLLEATDVLVLRSGRILERVTSPQYSRGLATGRIFSYRDISKQVEAQAQLRLAAKVFESSPDAIFMTGPDFPIVTVNPVCERLTGRSGAQLIGTSARQLFHDPQDAALMERIGQALNRHGLWEGDVWLESEGRPAMVVQLSWVLVRDAQGDVLHTIGFFRDLTEKLLAQQKIEQMAYSDALTGLPNRLLLSQRVDFALRMAERHDGRFAILFLDLDRFKTINDSMGHAFGDHVLLEVAERIKGCLRDVDTLCRLGGDEFVVLLLEADVHGAEAGARRIIEALASPFEVKGLSFSVSCSIGVALYPEDGRSYEELIKHADTAMYLAKDRGRGSFRFYQPQMNVDLLTRMKIDHAMRQAMEKEQFSLHYQPQISLATGALLGAEALIRWTDDALGPISPAVFIPIAEDSGFIVSIGNWVLAQAVRQAADWQRRGQPVAVSINVSAMQFQQADFVERIASTLRAEGLDPGLLELELTESILVKEAHEALSRLHALANLGVGLSIDDFGTGYSSLSYLKQIPISKLKIDRSFVSGLPGDESDRTIVSATIGMARALRLAVVAEGVETAAQRDFLAQLHCDSYQGFLCSPALPAEAFERLAATLPRAGG